MSDAKVSRAREDYDRANLYWARKALAEPGNPFLAHLVDWARRVLERLERTK